MKIYCETSCLPENIRRHSDAKSERELTALKSLAEQHQLFASRVIDREIMKTADKARRDALIIDYKTLQPIPKDEKLLGFHHQSDRYGFVTYPMISDSQNEPLRDELIQHGLAPTDAEHITQAVSNDCDVFLTRDERTIIIRHREWLEKRFPNLRVRLPSELLKGIAASEGTAMGNG